MFMGEFFSVCVFGRRDVDVDIAEGPPERTAMVDDLVTAPRFSVCCGVCVCFGQTARVPCVYYDERTDDVTTSARDTTTTWYERNGRLRATAAAAAAGADVVLGRRRLARVSNAAVRWFSALLMCDALDGVGFASPG